MLMNKHYIHIFLMIPISFLVCCTTYSPQLELFSYLAHKAPIDEVCMNATTNYSGIKRNASALNEFVTPKDWQTNEYIRAAKVRGGCGVKFSSYSDTEVCQQAVNVVFRKIEWADTVMEYNYRWEWNKLAAKEARKRNLLCGVGTRVCGGYCSTDLNNSGSFTDELLCPAATTVLNGQRIWESRSPNLIYLAKRRQINCNVSNNQATRPTLNQTNLSVQKPLKDGSWKERVRKYFRK